MQFKNSLLISFIPLPILLALQILSYQAISKSARQFHLSNNKLRTTKQVRKTFFAIIVVFLGLTAPSEIYAVTIEALFIFKQDMLPPTTLSEKLVLCYNLLISFNSCVNPFIYTKVHKRLLRLLQKIR